MAVGGFGERADVGRRPKVAPDDPSAGQEFLRQCLFTGFPDFGSRVGTAGPVIPSLGDVRQLSLVIVGGYRCHA